MATDSIEKFGVMDERIVPTAPKYAVSKGSLSVTSAKFSAIGESASQINFQIIVPSQNIYVDRYITIQTTFGVGFQFNDAGSPAGQPLAIFGQDLALCAFPFQTALVQNSSLTINDTTTTFDNATVATEVLRLVDYKMNRKVRTAPTMLDSYRNYSDAVGAINSPLNGYNSKTTLGEQPNGAYPDVEWAYPAGATVGGNSVQAGTPLGPGAYVVGGTTVNVTQIGTTGKYQPVASGVPGVFPVAIRATVTEPLMISPCIFADGTESEGLFGISNIQAVFNIAGNVSRVIRTSLSTVQNVALLGNPFTGSNIRCLFLTPSLDLALPSIVSNPYQQFSRYLSVFQSDPIAAGTTDKRIDSATITMPSVPDMMLAYVKPQTYANNEGDYYLPIRSMNITFDNVTGLLSNFTTEQLYRMTQRCGLDVDWETFYGRAKIANGAVVPTVGSPLCAAFGTDVALSAGLAPGVLGSFSLQVSLTVANTGATVPGYTLYILVVQSGFIQHSSGSSRIVLNPISEADVVSAEIVSRGVVGRYVGHGFLNRLGSMLSKAVDLYSKTKPAVSAMKGMLPEGKVKDVMGKLGYGMAGGAMPTGGRKMLSDRLM
jgi:hypothetical protein